MLKKIVVNGYSLTNEYSGLQRYMSEILKEPGKNKYSKNT